LRTPAAALAAAQKARLATPAPESVTILFRAGRHELAAPLMLSDKDSGATAQRPFTLAAFPGEKPVLSGGRRLTGWKPVPNQPGRWHAFNREHQLMRTRPEPHISFVFTNNIVCFDSGDLLGSNWSNDNYRMGGTFIGTRGTARRKD
jgi:hypothetical protein